MRRPLFGRWHFTSLSTVVASALGVITGLTVLGQLDSAFGAMHVPGQTSGTFSGVSGPSTLWSAAQAVRSIQGWYGWQATQIGVAHNIRVMPAAIIASVTEIVLIALPVALLLWLASQATARRFPAPGDADGVAHADLGALAQFAGHRRWPIAILVTSVLRGVLVTLAVAVGDGDHPILLRFNGAATIAFYAAIAAPAFALGYAHIAAEWGLRDEAEAPPRTHVLRRIGRIVIALRLQIIGVIVLPALLLVLGGGLGDQINDLALSWPDQWSTLISALVAALALMALVRVTGAACWRWYREGSAADEATRSGWWTLTAGLVLLVGYGVSFTGSAPWSILLWPGICLCGIGLITKIEKTDQTPALPEAPYNIDDTRVTLRLLDVLAIVPLAALAIVSIRAGAQLLVFRGQFLTPGTVYVAGGVLAIVICGILVSRPRTEPRTWQRYAAGVAAVIFAVVGLGCMIDPITWGQHIGALAILIAFGGVLLMVLFAFVWAVHDRRPTGPVELLRIRRVPVLTFFLVWLIVTTAIQGTDHYHDARLLPASAGTPRPITAAAAVSQWLNANASQQVQTVLPGTRTPVPMLFIASLGGGIRAAYWTNLVLDCLFQKQAAPASVASSCNGTQLDESQVFAESGVSGGAVGIAMHRALGDEPFKPALSQDFVSPDIAAMMFRDAPTFWLPTPLQTSGHDRAAVMEQAWEEATDGAMAQGLYAGAYSATGNLRFPITVLNSATVDDGCRLNVSVLDAAAKDTTASSTGCFTMAPFAPQAAGAVGSPSAGAGFDPALAGTKDVYDYLCAPGDTTVKHDLSLSTAALLAARFPYISPTGGLTGCSSPQRRTFAMDGGVLDNSGTSTMAEIWSSAAGQIADYNGDPANPSCVEPRLLIIDNSYSDPAPVTDPAQPQELLAPLAGVSAVDGSATQRDEQAAALEFQQAFGSTGCRTATGAEPPVAVPTRIALVQPSARPGPYAPLGWSLSTYAQDDLNQQIASTPNQCELDVVRAWFATAQVSPFTTGGKCVNVPATSASGPVGGYGR